MISQKILNIVLLLIITAYAGFALLRPNIALYTWGEDYKSLMFNCDHSMREHYIAKQAVEVSPSTITIKKLQASEVGLLDCHGYDKLRKKMIAWGLNGNDLSMLGIEALEEKEYELRSFVEIHEFRY